MSEESTTPDLVELARRMFAATNDRDLDAEMQFYAPDAVLGVTWTVGTVVRGRETIHGFLQGWRVGYEELAITAEEDRRRWQRRRVRGAPRLGGWINGAAAVPLLRFGPTPRSLERFTSRSSRSNVVGKERTPTCCLSPSGDGPPIGLRSAQGRASCPRNRGVGMGFGTIGCLGTRRLSAVLVSTRRVTAVCVLAVVSMLAAVSGAQAVEPMDVSLTVVNQRGINQFSYIKLAADAWFANHTDGNGQFSASRTGCIFGTGPCVRPGDHIHFSRDEGQTGPCAAPEDPAGLEYEVSSSPTQTVTLQNTTGESTHTSPTNTESWIVGKLNQDRAAHSPPLPPLYISSTLTRAAYAIAHDRALAPSHPYPPPHCSVNLSDWGWPAPGFLNEDSGYASPEATLAHWDGTAGDQESIYLAYYGVYNAANTAVGVADGGGTWIIEYNDCTGVALAPFVARCGMTSETGDPTAYTPPTTGGGGGTGGGTTGGSTGGAGSGGGGSTAVGGAVLSVGGGALSLAANSVAAGASGVAVTLSCAGATGKTCSGQVSVYLRERTRGRKVIGLVSSSHGATRIANVLVGLARFTLAAGGSKRVMVSLNRTGRSLLKRFHRLKVAVHVSVTTSSGLRELATRTVTIRAARTHGPHRK